MRFMFSLGVLVLSFAGLTAAAQEVPAPEAPEAASEMILVVGARPGPGLWKVSKGDHVLWIFGSYSPLPKKMEWRSQQTETILAQSQEYLAPPGASVNVGFFRGLTLLPHVFGVTKNPDGAQLKDLVPAETYARWLLLKEKYLAKGIDERERPIFVAEALYRSGLTHAGLGTDREIADALNEIVKKHKIKVTWPGVKMEVDDPAKMLKDFKKNSLDDVACFTRTLDRLESDLDALKVRANAWARGDMEGIQKLSFADRDQACSDAMKNGAFIQSQAGTRDMEARMQDAWIAAAEKALATNNSTFATLPLRNLLDPKGYLAALQAKGYVVQAPE